MSWAEPLTVVHRSCGDSRLCRDGRLRQSRGRSPRSFASVTTNLPGGFSAQKKRFSARKEGGKKEKISKPRPSGMRPVRPPVQLHCRQRHVMADLLNRGG